MRRRRDLFRVAVVMTISAAHAYNFTSSPATDLQPLFNVNAPWLGADIATSVCFSGSCVWLHGDTLVGTMNDGVRRPSSMPRNSVALLNTTAGVPTSPYTHFIRSHDGNPQHWGFFSPPNYTQWYWPIAGVEIAGDLYVIADRMGPGSGGLFNFVTAGVDVLYIPRPSLIDAMAWPAPVISTLPGVNNTFNIGHAATVAPDGFVYLLGSCGSNGQTAMMARIPIADFTSFNWDALAYWGGAGTWQPLGPVLVPVPLFGFVPSETTLFFHATLQAWYVVVANTFISDSISFRTAPALTGPWSDMQNVYAIPPEMLAGGAFCYAGKAHPELSAEGAPEIVFSFMCNTPTIAELENRTDVYVPQLIRTRILQ